MPQGTSDAIVAASTLVTSLQTIISRNLDPFKQGVLSIGVMRGGSTYNAICDHVHLEARSF